MAKRTFLELCQLAARKCGIEGSGPSAVTAQTGILKKLVQWVAEADFETCSRYQDWDFMLVTDWAANTVIGTAAVAAPASLGNWDRQSFYLDYSAATHSWMTPMDYREWRDSLRQGVKTNQRPSIVVFKPDGSLILEPPPDAVYSLTGEYQAVATRLAADDDESRIPAMFEMVIVHRACMFYAADRGDPVKLTNSETDFNDLLSQMEAKHRPQQARRTDMLADDLVVRPE